MTQKRKRPWKRRLASIFAAAAVSLSGAGYLAHIYDGDNASHNNENNANSIVLQPPPLTPAPPPALPPPPPPPPDPFSLSAQDNTFLYALGTSESQNDYRNINAWGCAGRWQFCPTSIDGPGWGKYDGNVQGWINDPAYQNSVMEEYTRNHWNEIVQLGLTRYIGQTVPSSRGPVFVTPAGLLGGAHLGGIGRLQDFLERGINRPDAGGTTIADYMLRFQNTTVPADWISLPAAPAPAPKGAAPSV